MNISSEVHNEFVDLNTAKFLKHCFLHVGSEGKGTTQLVGSGPLYIIMNGE